MKLLKLFQVGIVKLIKLDPVKAVVYEVARIAITQGLKSIAKSSKNKLDDEMIKPVIKSLDKKNA